MTENKITKDGIKELFKLDTKAKKVFNVEYIFQILSLKKNENNTEKAIYSATFSDTVHKYSGIVIIINDSNLNLQPFDLIKVKQLTISTFLKGNSQVETVIFIVKLFEQVETCAKKFGNPIDFKFIKQDKDEDKEKDKDRDIKKVKVEEEKVEPTVSSNPNSFFIRPSASSSSVDNSTNLSSEKNLLENFSKTKFDYNISSSNINSSANIKEENSKESITNYFPSTSLNSKVKYMPLSHLNTYSRNFTILVRIINKNEMKQYNNNKGGGNLFTFVMLDKEGTEME
jgi:hypothetical protein